MVELLKENPWLVVPCMALLIPIFGIVFGTLSSSFASVRRAELEAALKQDMLQRGMSAAEIKIVIEAGHMSKGKLCKPAIRMESEVG
jgi:hypothetical protein